MPSSGEWTFTPRKRKLTSKRHVATLAARQRGFVTWAQLRSLGVSEAAISRWRSGSYLIAVLPRVYAVGHLTGDEPSRLFSVALFAGPNAALSHGTAAHWRGWLRYPVQVTHVSTPRRIRTAVPRVVFHTRREFDRVLVNGIPCTTVTQTLLDLAATEPLGLVKRSLAQLDYERALDDGAIRAACGHRRRGSTALLEALDAHMPQLARTRSGLEDDFLFLCQAAGIPLPQVNTLIEGIEVDCYWPDVGLVVELDGGGNHSTAAQRNRDQRNAMALRSRGLSVIRYTADQVCRHGSEVAADLIAQRSGGRSLS